MRVETQHTTSTPQKPTADHFTSLYCTRVPPDRANDNESGVVAGVGEKGTSIEARKKHLAFENMCVWTWTMAP